MNGVAKKAAHGLGWLAIIRYSNRIAGFVTTLILARLVVPEDFGLIVIATMVMEFLNIMKDMGVSQALIYRRDELERAASTAFFLVLAVNFFLFLGMVLLSANLAEFFNSDRAFPILIVMASNLIWFGLRSVPEALIRKELEFRQLIVPSIVPVLVASVLSIWMAFVGYGVWALVARSLAVEILGTALIWRYSSFRPSLLFDKKLAKEILGYGKYIVGASVISVLLYNVDKFYIGRFASISSLGLYTLAYTIAHVPVGELGHLVCRVMFPALSKVNDDRESFESGFLHAIKLSSVVSIPLGVGIAVYGPGMVTLFFEPEWWGMAAPLQWLAIASTFRAVSVLIHEACKAAGKPGLVQKVLMYRLLAVSALGIPALKFGGLEYLAAVIAVAYGTAFFVELFLTKKWLGVNVLDVLLAVAYPAIMSIGLIGGIFWSTSLMIEVGSATHLAVGVAVSVIIYVLATIRLRPELLATVRATLQS